MDNICQDLLELSFKDFRSFLESFDTVICDCDGVLWYGDNVVADAARAVTRLAELGKATYFLTNNSQYTRKQFRDHLLTLGCRHISEDKIISCGYLAATYLRDKEFQKLVYVMGTEALGQELEHQGINHVGIGPDPMLSTWWLMAREFVPDPNVGAILVSFDPFVSYPKIHKASLYACNPQNIFIATHADERTNCFGHSVPGTGSMLASVEAVSRRHALRLGKPYAYVYNHLVDKCCIDPGRTLLIGDSCASDIVFGSKSGFRTLLVLSGISTAEDIEILRKANDPEIQCLIPDLYIEHLGLIYSLLD